MVGTTTSATGAAILAALFACGCGASQKDVDAAQTSGYDADFARVYAEVLEVVRDEYPNLSEDARTGLIKTAWHPIRIRQTTQDTATAGSKSGFGSSGGQQRLFFVRFNVAVIGGRPWRVRVEGQASAWNVGEVPTPLRGAEIPPWLKGRTDRLRVEIHQALEKYAVPVELAPVKEKPKPDAGKIVTAEYRELPPEAASVVRAVHQAASGRDGEKLKEMLGEELIYAPGATGSADVAMAVWQADGQSFQALARVLDGGCQLSPDQAAVLCPKEYKDGAAFSGYRARFEKNPSGTWKLVLFYSE